MLGGGPRFSLGLDDLGESSDEDSDDGEGRKVVFDPLDRRSRKPEATAHGGGPLLSPAGNGLAVPGTATTANTPLSTGEDLHVGFAPASEPAVRCLFFGWGMGQWQTV